MHASGRASRDEALELVSPGVNRQRHYFWRLVEIVGWLASTAALARAAAVLLTLPVIAPLVVGSFILPLLACLYLLADSGRFPPEVVRGCRGFLAAISLFVFLAQLPFVFPRLKPQFPGLPPAADRILVFHLFACALCLWLLGPACVFRSAFRARARGGPSMRPSILYGGVTCWVAAIAVVAGVFVAFNPLF